MSHNANSHELLSVVAAVHHERVGKALNDGALSLAETLSSIAASGVRDVDRGTDLNVIAVGESVIGSAPVHICIASVGEWAKKSD